MEQSIIFKIYQKTKKYHIIMLLIMVNCIGVKAYMSVKCVSLLGIVI